MKASHLVHCRGDEFTIDSGMSGSKARHSTLKRAPRRQDLCLDTGHFAYGGDPVRLVRRHHHRIRYLHLKSVDPVVRAKVKAEKIPFVKAVGLGVFSDLSEGVVDFPALRDIPREVNYDGWATVEQDMYPAPFDKPLPIAKRTAPTCARSVWGELALSVFERTASSVPA